MPRLPESLLNSLPAILQSRPERQIIEKKIGDDIAFRADQQGRVLPYFVTACENCNLNFTATGKIAQLTMEDCENLKVTLCQVVASVELIKCEVMTIDVSQARGTITLDMCREVKLQLTSASSAIVIYTSSCDSISIITGEQSHYHLPREDILKQGRYKTFCQCNQWMTVRCNLFGDPLDETK